MLVSHSHTLHCREDKILHRLQGQLWGHQQPQNWSWQCISIRFLCAYSLFFTLESQDLKVPIYKKDSVPRNEELALNTFSHIHFLFLLSAYLCSSPLSQILTCHEDTLKFGTCPCVSGQATGSQVQLQIKAAAHSVFNRNCWSCNTCKKKKKKYLQVVTDLASKTSENFHFNFTCQATHLKRQEQNHLFISWMCCENKFLQVNFCSGERKGFLCITVKICHSRPEAFPYPQTLQSLWHSFPEASPPFLLFSPSTEAVPNKKDFAQVCRRGSTCAVLQSLLQGCSGCTAPLPFPAASTHCERISGLWLLNSFCKSRLRRKDTIYQHRASQPTLTGHLTSSPRLFAALCSPSKMPNLCHMVMGWTAASPPSPELERGYTTKAQEEPRVPQSTSDEVDISVNWWPIQFLQTSNLSGSTMPANSKQKVGRLLQGKINS